MANKPLFTRLALNYSTNPLSVHRCKMSFPNTCAIRMSEALVKTDAKFLTAFKSGLRNVCEHGYIRGAQDLASILRRHWGAPSLGWSAQDDFSPPSDIKGQQGVICFMNIPGVSGQGHIDLWRNERAVGQAYWSAQTIWFWRLP